MTVRYLCYKATILIDFQDLDERLAAFVYRHGAEGYRLYLEELRWPGGVECPRCESGDVHWLERRARYHCRDCRYQFRVTARTVFHDSHLALSKWFVAVALMLSTAEGISASELRQILGGSYKSAWFLEHRIRSAMGSQGVLPAERRAVRPARRAAKYLAAYWNEARWRHEHRDNPNAFRDTVLALLDSPWLPYDVLTAA